MEIIGSAEDTQIVTRQEDQVHQTGREEFANSWIRWIVREVSEHGAASTITFKLVKVSPMVIILHDV